MSTKLIVALLVAFVGMLFALLPFTTSNAQRLNDLGRWTFILGLGTALALYAGLL
jgi:hypothetical protein